MTTKPDYEMLDLNVLHDISNIEGYWGSISEKMRVTALPDMLIKLEAQGRLQEFRHAADPMVEAFSDSGLECDDSDVYKWMEAASLSLIHQFDKNLNHRLEQLIDLVLAAADDTGYIDAFASVTGDPRWGANNGINHCLYNHGHLIEAAIAHLALAGPESRLFTAVLQLVDTIEKEYNDGLITPPAHQEIELALVRLYEVTNEIRYLRLAESLLDQRGHTEGRLCYGAYAQDHKPISDQHEIIGHAVRAIYQNIAAQAVAYHLNRQDLKLALDDMWTDMISRKIHLSGGFGTVHIGPNGIEGFGDPYELDPSTVDVDACSAIAALLWAEERLKETDDTHYADVVEHQMYNRILAGPNVSCTEWFYGMAMESKDPITFNGWGNATPIGLSSQYRRPWYRVPCCPPSIARFVFQAPLLAVRQRENQITIDQFITLDQVIHFSNADDAILHISTDFPYSGHIHVKFDNAPSNPISIRVRIPGWISGKAIDGQLYSGKTSQQDHIILIDGAPIPHEDSGYLVFTRNWSQFPEINIVLPMKVHTVTADKHVHALAGKHAAMYGPLVLCMEGEPNSLFVRKTIEIENAVVGQHPSLPGPQIILKDGAEMIPLNLVQNRNYPAFRVWF